MAKTKVNCRKIQMQNPNAKEHTKEEALSAEFNQIDSTKGNISNSDSSDKDPIDKVLLTPSNEEGHCVDGNDKCSPQSMSSGLTSVMKAIACPRQDEVEAKGKSSGREEIYQGALLQQPSLSDMLLKDYDPAAYTDNYLGDLCYCPPESKPSSSRPEAQQVITASTSTEYLQPSRKRARVIMPNSANGCNVYASNSQSIWHPSHTKLEDFNQGRFAEGLDMKTSNISEGIKSGQMKMDPLTQKFVPNDIFVQAMGPYGALPDMPPAMKHSRFRGVTKHRRSGRWEAHIWLRSTGKQMYLGAYEYEEHAAEAYDIAALKVKGANAKINFERSKYDPYIEVLDTMSLAELVKAVKRQIPPPVRNSSNYRGVTFNVHHSLWEAKYQISQSKHISLGLFKKDVEAARAFDRAMVRARGTSASINFDHSEYHRELLAFHQEQIHKLG